MVHSTFQFSIVGDYISYQRLQLTCELLLFQRLHCELPDAIIRQIPDCGHLPHVERPDSVVKLIVGFVQNKTKTANECVSPLWQGSMLCTWYTWVGHFKYFLLHFFFIFLSSTPIQSRNKKNRYTIALCYVFNGSCSLLKHQFSLALRFLIILILYQLYSLCYYSHLYYVAVKFSWMLNQFYSLTQSTKLCRI